MQQAGITPTDIGFIVVGTTTPDTIFPSTACMLQHKIGATHAWGFDLGAACSGFTYALTTGDADGRERRARPRARRRRRRDVEHHRLHRSRRRACCSATAPARSCSRQRERGGSRHIIDFAHEIDGSGGPALCMPAGGSRMPASHETVDQRLHYVKQDGQAVFKFAVRKTEEICLRVLERHGVDPARSTSSCRTRPTAESSRPPPSGLASPKARWSSTSSATATPPPRRSRWRSPTPWRRAIEEGRPGAADVGRAPASRSARCCSAGRFEKC